MIHIDKKEYKNRHSLVLWVVCKQNERNHTGIEIVNIQ